jgi:hypothetical protein
MRVRKKPVEVEAWLFDGTWQCIIDIIKPPIGAMAWVAGVDEGAGTARISTLEGDMTAQAGDWIIRGVKGEYYPCKHDIFAATYDLIE